MTTNPGLIPVPYGSQSDGILDMPESALDTPQRAVAHRDLLIGERLGVGNQHHQPVASAFKPEIVGRCSFRATSAGPLVRSCSHGRYNKREPLRGSRP